MIAEPITQAEPTTQAEPIIQLPIKPPERHFR